MSEIEQKNTLGFSRWAVVIIIIGILGLILWHFNRTERQVNDGPPFVSENLLFIGNIDKMEKAKLFTHEEFGLSFILPVDFRVTKKVDISGDVDILSISPFESDKIIQGVVEPPRIEVEIFDNSYDDVMTWLRTDWQKHDSRVVMELERSSMDELLKDIKTANVNNGLTRVRVQHWYDPESELFYFIDLGDGRIVQFTCIYPAPHLPGSLQVDLYCEEISESVEPL